MDIIFVYVSNMMTENKFGLTYFISKAVRPNVWLASKIISNTEPVIFLHAFISMNVQKCMHVYPKFAVH